MKIDWSFPRQVAVTLLVAGVLAGYPLFAYADADTMKAVAAGSLLATVNVLAGYAAIEYSFGKSTVTFMKYVLGGMGVRMLVLAVVLILCIKVVHLNPGALVGSMGILYVVFLALEILFIQKKVGIKHQA